MTFRKPELIPLLFIIASTALLVTFGLWQVERLAWKEGLIAQINVANQEAPLTKLPNDEMLESARFRHISLSGRFAEAHTLFRPSARQGGKNGYEILTPFLPQHETRYVLVHRGFINGKIEAVKAALPKEERITRIEGVLRGARQKRLFMPENQPEKRLWMTEDLPALAAELKAEVLPLVIEETTPCNECGMERSDGNISLRNDHFGYAITWFSLAAVGLIMFAFYHRVPKGVA